MNSDCGIPLMKLPNEDWEWERLQAFSRYSLVVEALLCPDHNVTHHPASTHIVCASRFEAQHPIFLCLSPCLCPLGFWSCFNQWGIASGKYFVLMCSFSSCVLYKVL